MSNDKKTIEFGRQELDPTEQQQYKDKIAAARGGGLGALKQSVPVGGLPKMQGLPLLQREAKEAASPIGESGGVQPRPPGSPILRPETAQALVDMQKAQAQQAEAASAQEAEMKKDIEEKKDDIFEMFDFAGKNEAERILNNKKRRSEIEARCSEITLEELIINDEVRQIVPIVPNRFWVMFRSPTPEESLFLKRYLSKETGSDQYVMEKLSLCQLALGIVSINDVLLPDHRDDKGEPNSASFEKKLKMLTKKSAYVIADLMVNFVWFDLRVRKLLNPGDLKNG